MDGIMSYEQKQLVTAHLSLVPRMVRALTRSFSHLSQDEFDELTPGPVQCSYEMQPHAALPALCKGGGPECHL